MTKSSAIRAVLKAAGRPITLAVLLPRLERKLKMIVGRHRLRTLLSVMQANDGDVRGEGRGDGRTYSLARKPRA